jgi:hypothetical protein
MAAMKLIREELEFVSSLVVENTAQGKKHFIEGIFMQMEVPNKNKRFYPRSVVEPELARYVTEVVQPGRAWGELGHPDGPKINLPLVSHRITELNQDGNDVYGKALLTNTPMGQIAIGLMESGGQLGVSSRGLGAMSAHKNLKGIQEVNVYRIATAADIVHDPSAPNAYVQGIMEGAEWILDPISGDWVMQEMVEETRKEFSQSKPSLITEGQKLAAFEKFLNGLTRISK